MNAIEEESSDDEFITHRKKRIILAYYYLKKRRSRPWLCRHIQHRARTGEFTTLFYELDENHFYTYYRVTRAQFFELLTLIIGDITKQDTNYRKAITAEEKLAICLRFLATGDSFRTIAYNYRVGNNTVSQIINDVCKALWIRLQPTYMKLPTEREWKQIAKDFYELWQFPNCLGAIDGKHISIKCPPNSGSNYFNYKKFFSIVLLAVVDAHKKFIIIDIGSMGRFSDGGIFADSPFGYKLRNGQLELPDDKSLTPGGTPTPFVFVGDQAFPLQKHLMRPYPRGDDRAKNKFNYQLSRARNVVENAFGLLSMRFRIFRRPFECKLELVDVITQTACVLHNYLISSRMANTTFNDNEEEQPLRSVERLYDNLRATREAMRVRESFCDHFNNSHVN